MSNILRALAAERARRGIGRQAESAQEVAEKKIARIEADTFPEQLALIRDDAKRIVVPCPRRAAKTTGLARRYLVRMLRKPGYRVPWLAGTKDDARAILEPVLRELDALYELGIKFRGDGFWTLPNSSWFRIGGLHDISQVQKPRGLGYDAVVIDETQLIRIDLEEFVRSVVMPALMDRRGDLVLAGTPDPKRLNRVWADAITGMGKMRFAKHWWPVTANKFLPDPEGYLREMREEMGYTEDDPRYRAEFMGDVNAFDSVALMIQDYLAARNWVPEIPGEQRARMHYVVGWDIGLVDRAAYVVFGYSFASRLVYIMETFSKSRMDVTEQGLMLVALAEKYRYLDVIADEGALGKLISVEVQNRFPGLSIQPAEKTEKALAVKMMNTDLRTGRLIVAGPVKNHDVNRKTSNLRLLDQWNSTVWDERHHREAEGQEVDLLDAALYGWRACKTFRDQQPDADPVDDWERQITDRDQGKRVQVFKRGR